MPPALSHWSDSSCEMSNINSSPFCHHVSKFDILQQQEQVVLARSKVVLENAFNRDEWKLRKKQEKINLLLKMALNKTDDDGGGGSCDTKTQILPPQKENNQSPQTEDRNLNQIKITTYQSAEEIRLRRLSRRNQQLLSRIQTIDDKVEPPGRADRSKSFEAGLNFEHKQPEVEVIQPARKTSLPAIALLPGRYKHKQKCWFRDKEWLKEPEEGVAEADKIQRLKSWLDSLGNTVDLADLFITLDWANNRPAKVQRIGPSYDQYYPIRSEKYLIEHPPDIDSLHKFTGECKLSLTNGDTFRGNFEEGRREGKGTLTFGVINKRKLGLTQIEGCYSGEVLTGPGVISYENGDQLYCDFIQGIPFGPAKLFDGAGHIKQVGLLNRGIWSGLCWQYLPGGSYITGNVDFFGQMTGDSLAYIYPDLKHCIFGSFNKGHLSVGQFCYISTIRFMKGHLPSLTFSPPKGPIYSYERGTQFQICENPLLPDPYELNHVYVKQSKMKGGGEGLFARRDVSEGKIVSFYNGVKILCDEEEDRDKELWELHAYKIMDMLGKDPDSGKLGIIDIPEFYVSTKNYLASLAHKCNHSFDPNAKFVLCHHPRFGPVPSVKAIKDIKADCEITVSYDYGLDDAPPWYQDLYAKRIVDSYLMSKADAADDT